MAERCTVGVPGLVMPAGLSAHGMPVAREFDGRAGSDRALLALGVAAEHVPGTGPPPRI